MRTLARRRLLWTPGLILVCGLAVIAALGGVGRLLAQENPPAAQFGDPPLAERITLSAPDEAGLVTIEGLPGAVFPGAVVGVRNLYTGEAVYQRAELTGAFILQIYGPGNTPFWISPAERVDPAEALAAGSIPGGPGLILTAPLPDEVPSLPDPPEAEWPATPIVIDGDAGEWATLAMTFPVDLGEGRGAWVSALANRQSLYLALTPQSGEAPLPEDYGRLEIGLRVEEQTFTVVIDPARRDGGRLIAADGGDLGPLAALSAQGSAIELRLPRLAFTGFPSPITMESVRFTPVEGTANVPAALALEAAERDEVDAPAQALDMPTDAAAFTLAGPVGGGSGSWYATGRVNRLGLQSGEMLLVEMAVTLDAPGRVSAGDDLRLGARLRLEPVLDATGAQTVADRATGNGWSGQLTPSGLAIQNVAGGYDLGTTPAQNLSIVDDRLTFVLQWQAPLDGTLPGGTYVPALEGFAAVTGVSSAWGESGVLGSSQPQTQVPDVPEARLPVTLHVGARSGEPGRLLTALFYDHPAGDGARGLLPQEEVGVTALGSRVAHPSPMYVLPRLDSLGNPIAYPLEPYLPAMLGNSFSQTLGPLLALDLPGGELTVSVTGPDGTVDDLGTRPIVQNRLSSVTRSEAQAFGTTSPLDVYRLTTLDPALAAYTFQQDGHYVVRLSFTVADVWGNPYTGGGTYDVWVGDALVLRPGVLTGTPFEVGDVFNPALTVAPAFPAEVSIRLMVYPLDGGDPIAYAAEGTASRFGFFLPEDARNGWILDTPGEYVVDTTARYTDSQGRLWLGSRRGAGVIASPEGSLIARGGRGLSGPAAEDRLAWYVADRHLAEVRSANPAAQVRWPYHSGDVLWARDGGPGIAAMLRLTDTLGGYAAWLVDRLSGWTAEDGLDAAALANEDELPLVTPGGSDAADNSVHAYISAVRPGISVRQLVLGDETAGWIEPGWSLNDPYNSQPGSGINGDLPGDMTFLFGGVIVHNADLNLHEAAIYGALGLTVAAGDPGGDRVYPPLRGAANGADGGPLLTVRGEALTMTFTPTGFQPGQVFTVGDTLALSGQVAPTLPARVTAEVSKPSGLTLVTRGQANAVGYYYDPVQNLPLDEPGVWRIRLRVDYDGLTSTGMVQPPAAGAPLSYGTLPGGTVLGAVDSTFAIYVLPEGGGVIQLTNPMIVDGRVPAAQPFNVVAAVPEGWTNIQAEYTVTMPGVILEEGQQPALGGIFAYNYDPRRINQVFPNLDISAPGGTPLSVDTVTITFVLRGTDAEGQPAIGARVVTLLGDRLVTLYDGWQVPES